jgi:hypothetical protein
MKQNAAHRRGVATMARQLLRNALDRAPRETLKVPVISIVGPRADSIQREDLKAPQGTCIDPGPCGFDFPEDDPTHQSNIFD